MCGRRLRQRRLLKSVFLLGLKKWGLGGPRDILPRDRYIAWWSENLLGGFREMRGGLWRQEVCFKFTHTQRKTRWRPMGHFHKLWYFFNIILYSILGPDAYSAVRGQHIRAKNIKDAKTFFNIFLKLQTLCTVQGHSAYTNFPTS